MKPRLVALLLFLAIAAACAAPFVTGNYWLRVLTNVYMFAIVAQGLNVIVGFAGYHAFGNSAFFGIGAYAAAIALNAGLPVLLAVPAGVLVSAAFAGALGWPLLRLQGHYFAIATVALNMALIEAVINAGGITGGAQGLPLPISSIPPYTLYRLIYYGMLGTLVASTVAVWALSFSKLGFAMKALRDSEAGAEVMGVDTVRTKIIAWMISAAMTGAAGGIWAYWITFIETSSAFDISLSVRAYIMMLLGGMGTIFGPILGAAMFEIFATVIWSNFSGIHNLLLGALIVLIVILFPSGVIDAAKKLFFRPQRARP